MLKNMKKIKSHEDGEQPVLAHSDNTSTLFASSDGLVPKCHHMSALDHWGRSTVDTVYTIYGCSPEADKR